MVMNTQLHSSWDTLAPKHSHEYGIIHNDVRSTEVVHHFLAVTVGPPCRWLYRSLDFRYIVPFS